MKIVTETERLILREISMDDFPDLYAIYSDAVTMKYYPEPYSEDKVRALIRKCREQYAEHGHCLWAVMLKSEGKLIGDCGIIRQIVKGNPENEIGYHLHRDYLHRGFATEAALACKQIGFEQFKYRRLISLVRPENVESARVAERIGFRKLDEVYIFGYGHIVYGEAGVE